MQKQNDFETACKNLTEGISIFKEEIVSKCAELQDAEWLFDKGTTKVCKADENGKKKRCKVGICYISKIALTNDAAIEIWRMFSCFSSFCVLICWIIHETICFTIGTTLSIGLNVESIPIP